MQADGQVSGDKRDLTGTSWDETGYDTSVPFRDDRSSINLGVGMRRVLKVSQGAPDKPVQATLQMVRIDNEQLIREYRYDGTWDGVTLSISRPLVKAQDDDDGKETLNLRLIVKESEPTRLVGTAGLITTTASGPIAAPERAITFEDSGDRLPVIFLPGVAGTILNSDGFEVWPLSPVEKRGALALETDGVTPALGRAIGVGDILRRPGMDFYGTFIKLLEYTGYKSGTDLFAFPYDWRMSNDSHYADLDRVIADALERSKKKKVILTAHSMGGVIARGYIYSRPDRAAKVDSLITMGTPYWGAPKVYYGITSGYQFGNPTARQPLMKVLMQNMPAAYQLLPQKPFVTDRKTGQLLDLDATNTIRYKWFSNIETRRLGEDTYTETTSNDRTFNPALMARARQFYSAVGTQARPAPVPRGVKQYAIIGTGVSTVNGFEMEEVSPGLLDSIMGWKSYLELGDGRKVVMHPQIRDGDGTVPIWSLESGAAGVVNYYVPHTAEASSAHGDLPANPTVMGIALRIIKHKPPEPGAYPRPLYWLDKPTVQGVEVEDNTQFELHSDAHLRITGPSGRTLGFNAAGGIDENLPGTFLAYEGIEYAAVTGRQMPLKVTVDGIRTGKFSLNVKLMSGGSPAGEFMYKEIPVTADTRTEFSFTPSTASTPPDLLVSGPSGKTTVKAVVIQPLVPGGGKGPGATATGAAGPFLGTIASVGGTVTGFKFFENKEEDLPAVGLRPYKSKFTAAGLKAIYFEFSVKYATDNTASFGMSSIWKRNGELLARQDLAVSKPSGLNTSTKTYGFLPPNGKWDAGNYVVEIEVNGERVASATFVVE